MTEEDDHQHLDNPSTSDIPGIDPIGTMMGAVSASRISELRGNLRSRNAEVSAEPTGSGGAGRSTSGGGGPSQNRQADPSARRDTQASTASVGMEDEQGSAGRRGVRQPRDVGVGSSGKGKELVVTRGASAGKGKELAVVPVVPASAPAVGRPRKRLDDTALVVFDGAKEEVKKKGKAKEEDDKLEEAAQVFKDQYYTEDVQNGYVFGQEARFKVSLVNLQVNTLLCCLCCRDYYYFELCLYEMVPIGSVVI